MLPESDQALNVGQENNPAIQITDADAGYLITKSNRDANMCSFLGCKAAERAHIGVPVG